MLFGRPLVYTTKGIGLGLGLEHYIWSVCLGFGLENKVLVDPSVTFHLKLGTVYPLN